MSLWKKRSKAVTVYDRPVARQYMYAGELAARAQALVYGAQPLVSSALMGDYEVIEGDGCWQMKTEESRSFGLVLCEFKALADALKGDPVIQVTGYAYDKKGDIYPYPNAYHSFKSDSEMEEWLNAFGASHVWYYHVRSLGVSVRARKAKA